MQDGTDNKKPVFRCDICDYTCNKKFLFNQHLETKKHQKNTGQISHDNSVSIYCSKNMPDHKCMCGKTYKHIQSYNRHIKECSVYLKNNDKDNEELRSMRSMISTLINQNQNILLENKEMRDMLKDVIPMIGNNNTTITNKFNLQFFLNEQCKDAINLTEFVDTLKLGLSDLDETRRNGYASGIIGIILRGLKELDLHKRPIHCSDLKREVLYVKDNDTWEKDTEEKEKLKKVITGVAKKQIDKIKEWEAQNPNWNDTEEGTEMYIEMIRNVTDVGDKDNVDKVNNRIIKTIAKEVIIEK